MEGMLGCSAFVEYISRSLSPEIGDFCLVDIGCSGGMDREWEGLGRRLGGWRRSDNRRN